MLKRRWMACCLVLCIAATPWSAAWAQAQRRQVDWQALNPAFAGATFVNDAEVCAGCHEAAISTFNHTPHARASRAGSLPGGGCESCHGPRSRHVAEPGPEWAWARLTATQQSTVCQQCHAGGARMNWASGGHLAADVSCTSCHRIMAPRSERALLAGARVPETCYTCHAATRTQMSRA